MKPRPLTEVRRAPEKQVRDRAALDAVLDAALVAHVAVPAADRLAVIPVGSARDGDRLLIHGSTGSQAFRTLATGVPTCVTITLLDGLVVARSQFEASMNYRCAMLFGSFSPLTGAVKSAAFATLTRHLLPGIVDARPPSAKESAATTVLALPIAEWSLKVSAKDGPEDDVSDLERAAWAGVVPLSHTWGEPVPAPDLAPGVLVPAAIAGWQSGRA